MRMASREKPMLDLLPGAVGEDSPDHPGRPLSGSKGGAVAAAIIGGGTRRLSMDMAAAASLPTSQRIRRPTVEMAPSPSGSRRPSMGTPSATRAQTLKAEAPVGRRNASFRAAAMAASLCARTRPKGSSAAAETRAASYESDEGECTPKYTSTSALDMLAEVVQAEEEEEQRGQAMAGRVSEAQISAEIDSYISSMVRIGGQSGPLKLETRQYWS